MTQPVRKMYGVVGASNRVFRFHRSLVPLYVPKLLGSAGAGGCPPLPPNIRCVAATFRLVVADIARRGSTQVIGIGLNHLRGLSRRDRLLTLGAHLLDRRITNCRLGKKRLDRKLCAWHPSPYWAAG